MKRHGLIRRLMITRTPGQMSAGRLQAGVGVIACSVGRNGVTSSKREGDGKTPRGCFRLIGGYWREDRLQRVSGADAPGGIQRHHAGQQVQSIVTGLRQG